MTLNDLISQFLASRALSVRPRTMEWYHYNLDPLADTLGQRSLDQVTIQELEAFLACQAQGRSPQTVKGFYTAINTLFNWAVQRNHLPSNPVKKIPNPKRRLPKKIPEVFTDAEVRALLTAVDNRRDRAILLTLLDTGIRRHELLALDVKDADFQEGFLLVHGKGDKDRYVPIEPTALDALREMLIEHPKHGPLFRNRYGQRLQPLGLRSMLLRLKRRAGLECRVHPHKFRHTFARNYLKWGDLESLRDILGHATIAITSEFYASFIRGHLKEKHRRCSPVENLHWGQPQLW